MQFKCSWIKFCEYHHGGEQSIGVGCFDTILSHKKIILHDRESGDPNFAEIRIDSIILGKDEKLCIGIVPTSLSERRRDELSVECGVWQVQYWTCWAKQQLDLTRCEIGER
jgi:hypothetical protein